MSADMRTSASLLDTACIVGVLVEETASTATFYTRFSK
jgi:hypothetical protein